MERRWELAPVAHQAEQKLKGVDEVQVKTQRADHGNLGVGF